MNATVSPGLLAEYYGSVGAELSFVNGWMNEFFKFKQIINRELVDSRLLRFSTAEPT
jgi:hypothetical protein